MTTNKQRLWLDEIENPVERAEHEDMLDHPTGAAIAWVFIAVLVWVGIALTVYFGFFA